MLLFTMLLILASGQLFRAIYAVAAQSVFLGIAGAVLGAATGNVDLWVIAGITIVIKAIVLPWLLIWVVKRISIRREIEPVIPINVTLGLAAGIVVLSVPPERLAGPGAAGHHRQCAAGGHGADPARRAGDGVAQARR